MHDGKLNDILSIRMCYCYLCTVHYEFFSGSIPHYAPCQAPISRKKGTRFISLTEKKPHPHQRDQINREVTGTFLERISPLSKCCIWQTTMEIKQKTVKPEQELGIFID